jgi:DNA-binding NtrC family response regulator
VQKTNVRVIAATNVNLHGAIEKGKFREDLYYRLNTVPIEIPPLRERAEDVPLLFRKFSVDFSEKYGIAPVRLDDSAQEILKRFSWPGNIRQLRNIAEQVNVLEKNRFIQGEEFLKYLPDHAPKSMPVIFDQNNPNDLSEREILYKLLFEMKRDITELKKVVGGFSPSTNSVAPSEMSIIPDSIIPPDSSSWMPASPTNAFVISENISPRKDLRVSEVEDIEENLSLMEVEKRMIEKSLQKHRGRRKNAALELGISERTLYRKIKEYGLED